MRLLLVTMNRPLDHLYIFAMIAFTVYSQAIMRWQVGLAGALPVDAAGKAAFILRLLMNPWVLSSVAATFLAGVSWMLALTKFQLSYAYPFTGVIYALILILGAAVFRESISAGRVAGVAVVMLGVLIIARTG